MIELGAGVFEIVADYDGDTYRAVYAVKLKEDIYVQHSFQNKSTIGIKTPKPELDLIKARLRRIKQELAEPKKEKKEQKMTEDQSQLEIEVGSGNVFADLSLEDAPELKLKAAIVGQINSILRHRHLTQVQASELLGLPQPKISALKNGKLRGFSLEKLLEIMVKLDRDVEISFSKSSKKDGSRYFIRNEKVRTFVVA